MQIATAADATNSLMRFSYKCRVKVGLRVEKKINHYSRSPNVRSSHEKINLL